MEDLYDVARKVTDETFGEGTYAETNSEHHPDPGVRQAVRRWKAGGSEDAPIRDEEIDMTDPRSDAGSEASD